MSIANRIASTIGVEGHFDSLDSLRASLVPDSYVHTTINQQLADHLGCKLLESDQAIVADSGFISEFPISLARNKLVLGLRSENEMLRVAICNEDGLALLDTVARLLKRQVDPVVVAPEKLAAAINKTYEKRDSQTNRNIRELEAGESVLRIDKLDREDLLDQTGRPTIIRLVNSILFDAA